MFTGIVETTGTVVSLKKTGTNISFEIESPISSELRADQSVSHNGVCLTVENVEGHRHTVTAIEETLNKSNLGSLQPGEEVNIERCLPMNGRLDGHLVQGHVDGRATCVEVRELEGSREYRFEYDPQFAHLLIEKGSICLNGISLTIFDLAENRFSVAIIPYTFEHTNLKNLEPGDLVNLEFDIIGKYLARWKELGI